MRGNVVDLAVAVVIGAAFTNIVNAVVKGIINPLVGAFGTQNLDEVHVLPSGPLCSGSGDRNRWTASRSCGARCSAPPSAS